MSLVGIGREGGEDDQQVEVDIEDLKMLDEDLSAVALDPDFQRI